MTYEHNNPKEITIWDGKTSLVMGRDDPERNYGSQLPEGYLHKQDRGDEEPAAVQEQKRISGMDTFRIYRDIDFPSGEPSAGRPAEESGLYEL